MFNKELNDQDNRKKKIILKKVLKCKFNILKIKVESLAITSQKGSRTSEYLSAHKCLFLIP